QKEVRQRLSKATTELDEGIYHEPCKLLVRDWMDTYLKTYAKRSVKDSTFGLYQSYTDQHINPGVGNYRLEALTTPILQDFYNNMSDEDGLSAKTVKNIHGVLHTALRQAVKLGMLRFNPTENCDLPKIVRKEMRPLEGAQIADFLHVIQGTRYEWIDTICMFTGLRQGEILGLTWDCVDFKRNILTINKQLQKKRCKGGKYRLVPTKNSRIRVIKVAFSVMDILRRRKTEQAEVQLLAGQSWSNPDHLVFTDELGGTLSAKSVYREFKNAVSKIGLDETRFHDLRHTFAVASIQNGDDIKTVQSNLGHATAAFTLDVYGHMTQTMRDHSADRMEQFIQQVSTHKGSK
ncbi:MAG: site-specific integrase, partial [Oscillospiraceae bacterium]